MLVEKLRHLGFNSYEAKVYLALLRHHPATGYEISQHSGVPQARVYDTLRALETSHVVVSMGEKPVTYSPISPEELLDRFERSFRSNMNHLREVLPTMSDGTIDPVLNLRGEASVMNHVRDMLQHAQATIHVEAWPQELASIEPILLAAQERGVDVKLVGYNGAMVDHPTLQMFHHGYGDTIEQTLGSRWLILCVDDHEGLVGMFPSDGSTTTEFQGVYTRNSGIVMIIKMLIIHDMYLIDVESKLGKELEATYGKGLLRLRQRILGEQATLGFH